MAYNPADDLLQVRVPALALTGAKDLRVDPADLRCMAERLPCEFEWHELPDITHMLRADPGAPSMATYQQQVTQPLDPRVLETISDWLLRHAGEKAAAGAADLTES